MQDITKCAERVQCLTEMVRSSLSINYSVQTLTGGGSDGALYETLSSHDHDFLGWRLWTHIQSPDSSVIQDQIRQYGESFEMETHKVVLIVDFTQSPTMPTLTPISVDSLLANYDVVESDRHCIEDTTRRSSKNSSMLVYLLLPRPALEGTLSSIVSIQKPWGCHTSNSSDNQNKTSMLRHHNIALWRNNSTLRMPIKLPVGVSRVITSDIQA